VRIPLDYYRILGLPILATADQIRQAYRDRTLQLPRQEFSTQAVASRKALLKQAHELLTQDEKRRDYDARFLATTYESNAETPPPPTPSQTSDIEVEESQFVGGLVLLQELGEYESVLRLGRPYLNPTNTAIKEARLGEPQAALSDIVLAISLACLELGREEWQQGHYDNAAEALETGQELLMREGLFPAVRAEVQADLYKLRPYRILAMLSDPDEDAPIRQRGLEMLRDMLGDRQGIDGNGIDQSGLGVDDFLRFIQQLRDYMTVDEQQALFEAEARRPSAVATYLSVYALMAKGFARQEPALIRRAKAMLARLGSRQDVYLEQSICSLLLGQPDAAAKALERSQEYEPLAFIRDHSQDATDLLPGLCLYTERWMQEEVFPHFRDLTQHTASLKDYFANPQVQEYLEELPLEAEVPLVADGLRPAESHRVGGIAPSWDPSHRDHDASRLGAPATWAADTSTNGATPMRDHGAESGQKDNAAIAAGALGAAGLGAAALGGTVAASWKGPEAAAVAENSPGAARKGRRRRAIQPIDGANGELPTDGAVAVAPRPPGRSAAAAEAEADKPTWLVPLLGLFLLGLLGYAIVQWLKPRPVPIAANPNPPTRPAATPTPTPATGVRGEMNDATAKALLQFWFDAKKAAFGSNHDATKLAEILTEPRLSNWRSESVGAKEENLTIAYDHTMEVKGVEVSPTNPNQATVTAAVREKRSYAKNGAPLEEKTDDLVLNYSLVREGGQWKIKDW
jgi:ARC6-like, IMS domain/DnaJ domain